MDTYKPSPYVGKEYASYDVRWEGIQDSGGIVKHKLIFDKVFRSEVLFYVCENGEKVISHIKKKYNVIWDSPGFDGYKGTCVELFDKKTKITTWLIWVSDKKDWKSMVHETSHLVFRILDKRGVKYSSDNDETFCYLHEYFVSEFWHVMCN